jgi:hypothetical protein
MTGQPAGLVGRVIVRSTARPDRLVRWLLLVIALGLGWQALRPELAPARAEPGCEPVHVNLERVGGRFLGTGLIPLRCGDLRR